MSALALVQIERISEKNCAESDQPAKQGGNERLPVHN
jgi:hypothetical protein